MNTVLVVLSLVAALAVLVAWFHQRAQRLTARERLAATSLSNRPLQSFLPAYGVPEGSVARWLFLAGYRRSDAPMRFWAATIALAVLGVVAGCLLWFSGALGPLRHNLEVMPGRVGYLFVPIVIGLPFALPLMLAALPTARVRRARRARVRLVLRDLYPVLELFASLAQAGLAFDAALDRVLVTLGSQRPLGRELLVFQAEVLGGSDRSRCFRRLARRIEVPPMSSFTSALIRAHEVGISLAATLRRQADDLRSELRERALARAQSLPARLVFPLVLCFLPGIFVMSLGPAFYGFLEDTSSFGSTR
jgi:tight adherence protein C